MPSQPTPRVSMHMIITPQSTEAEALALVDQADPETLRTLARGGALALRRQLRDKSTALAAANPHTHARERARYTHARLRAIAALAAMEAEGGDTGPGAASRAVVLTLSGRTNLDTLDAEHNAELAAYLAVVVEALAIAQTHFTPDEQKMIPAPYEPVSAAAAAAVVYGERAADEAAARSDESSKR